MIEKYKNVKKLFFKKYCYIGNRLHLCCTRDYSKTKKLQIFFTEVVKNITANLIRIPNTAKKIILKKIIEVLSPSEKTI